MAKKITRKQMRFNREAAFGKLDTDNYKKQRAHIEPELGPRKQFELYMNNCIKSFYDGKQPNTEQKQEIVRTFLKINPKFAAIYEEKDVMAWAEDILNPNKEVKKWKEPFKGRGELIELHTNKQEKGTRDDGDER